MSYRQGYFADKEFGKFTAADKERQLEDALMLENPVTDINIAMEVNYFQLNSAEYFVPVAVKIPGSELALARRGGANETLIDFIGEVKDDFGNTIQNLRDKLDIKLSDSTAAPTRDASDPVRDRIHAAARQVCHQVSRPRRRDRQNRHLPNVVCHTELEQRGQARSHQFRRPEQPARASRRFHL